jgi:hypothetical protein
VTRRAAALCLLLTVAVAATGCGSGKTKQRREDVAAYILRVDTIEAALSRPLGAISKANRAFALKKASSAKTAASLRDAAAKIDVQRARLERLHVPPDAAKLQPLMVRLATLEASLTREVAQLATFLPAFSRALKPLAAAGGPLKVALGSKAAPQVKATALDTYASQLGAVLVALAKLQPPAVSRAVYATQVATLRQVRDSASALAEGLRTKDAKALPKLLHDFDAAAVANQSLAAQQAQAEAIRAYDNRIKALNLLTVRVHKEQSRLQRLLG